MLQALGPYLRVSFLFFADMMLTVLMTERFHITFSPFVNTYFNPLATHWYRRYGRFMRHIILEIDMTRLGFGPDRQAYKLRAGNMNLDTLIQMFVDVQLRRQDESTMSSFVLLCRRFYGCRPTVIDHITGLDPCFRIPYCPDTAFSVCNPLLDLAGLVDSIRICGFSNTFTHTLVHNIFPQPPTATTPDLLKHHAYRVTPSPLWPRLPGQSSRQDIAAGRVHHDDHDADMPPPPRVPPGPIMLPAPHVTSRGVTFLDTPTTSHDSRSTASVRRAARFGVLASKVRERKASVAADIETLERRVQGLVSRLRRRSSRTGLRAMASREGLRQRNQVLEHVDAQRVRPEWSKGAPPSPELPNFLDDSTQVYGEKTEKVRRVRSKASVPVMSPVKKAAELKYRPSMPELRQKVSKMASRLDLRARRRAGETLEGMEKEVF
ncbi:hypothetical protein D7B24_006111 [Verticillium nonalfalfae]|uniref:Uncharacterized protein n=1 Tax=Verticillium nonalfalfae TaxID=1051616 RepID=A0A3M9YCQ8_9PEZI|nr:uncharacterized protein D7B24_006111 [Verticillium nonalfalfae]RNJ57348.1 hypothetical protein D7B24_006111 [Verticillium nonalfalfae]